MEAKRNFSGKNGMVYRTEGKTEEPGFPADGEQRWPPTIVIRGGENRLPSSWTVFMTGDGAAWRRWTHHYQTNRQWVLDKHKQDQTLTGHVPISWFCRGSERSDVDTWQQTQASWLQIWCEHQVSSGFGIKIFFFFFFSNKPSRNNACSCCIWRSCHHRGLWFQALKPTHMKAFRNFFLCNSDGHRISSEKEHCRLQEVTVITHLFSCLLWSPPGVV